MCLVCVYLLSVLSLCVVLFPCVDVVMHVANPLSGAGAFTYMIMCVSSQTHILGLGEWQVRAHGVGSPKSQHCFSEEFCSLLSILFTNSTSSYCEHFLRGSSAKQGPRKRPVNL